VVDQSHCWCDHVLERGLTLNGRTVLVTGAGSGIGAAIATRFRQAGYQVTLFDLSGAAAQRVASRIPENARTLVTEGDVADESQVQAAVEQTVAEFGSLDVLINNAGIEINGTVVEQPSSDWDRQIAVNLRSVYLLSKYAIPHMVRRGGSIINIASVHAAMSWPRCPAYDATKAGIIGITRAMAVDHGRDGIRVNAICPGYIETPLLAQWFASGAANRDEVLKSHPLGRIGTPDDVADAALFLASDAAAFISGTSLTVDGALTALGH
jgi:NAD(P)-dependent dehydrogenase (short-subunit alcohol dehydrogenase family)